MRRLHTKIKNTVLAPDVMGLSEVAIGKLTRSLDKHRNEQIQLTRLGD